MPRTLSFLALAAALASLPAFANADDHSLRLQRLMQLPGNALTACAVLSDDMENTPQLDALDAYVEAHSVKSRDPVPLRVAPAGKSLCFTGLKGGHRYEITLKKGLKSSSGLELSEDTSSELLMAKPQDSIIMEHGTLLPRSLSSGKVVMAARGFDTVRLHLWKIPSEALVSSGVLASLQDALSPWDLSSLLSKSAVKLGQADVRIPGDAGADNEFEADLAALAGGVLEDGVYILAAGDPKQDFDSSGLSALYDSPRPWFARTIAVSDLGMSLWRGRGSLNVAVRSLKSANAVAGARVSLISEAGTVLAEALTDSSGYASFKPENLQGRGGAAPAGVRAVSGSDMAAVSLKTRLDLPGISDSAAQAPEDSLPDAYAFTDRGISRLGEAVKFTALLRDAELSAPKLEALTLKLRRPDGAAVNSRTVKNSGAGFFEAEITLPESGPRGLWHLELSADDRHVLASAPLTVSDYVPRSIRAKALDTQKVQAAGAQAVFPVEARYGYGAPGAGLSASGELTVVPDPHPFVNYKDWWFGPNEEMLPELERSVSFEETQLDSEGRTAFKAALDDSGYAMLARLSGSAFNGSDSAPFAGAYKIRPQNPLIGVKHGTDSLEAAVVNPQGDRVSADLRWTLFERHLDWQYVYDNGAWRYLRSESLIPQGSGRVSCKDNAPCAIPEPEADGFYRLKISDGKTQTVYDFTRGYDGGMQALRPDMMALLTDKESYEKGDKAAITFTAPSDGTADLALGTTDIISVKRFEVKKGENTLSVRVPDSGRGVHAMVTFTAPVSSVAAPARVIGVTFLKTDAQAHRLKTELQAPQSLRPGERLEADIRIDCADGPAFYTASLTDTGILDLTNYHAPDPQAFFEKPWRFAIQSSDLYGMLLRAFKGAGQGYGDGDEDMMMKAAGAAPEALAALRDQGISVWQGVTEIKDGKAHLSFKIPEHQGALRLSVVTATDKACGSASVEIPVKAEAALNAALPVILHQGDEAQIAVSAQNLELQEGAAMSLSSKCEGAISCDAAAQDLGAFGKDGVLKSTVKVKAEAAGPGSLTLTLASKDGFKLIRTLKTQVPEGSSMVTAAATAFVKHGQSLTLKPPLSFAKGSHAVLTYGALPFADHDFIGAVKQSAGFEPLDLPLEVLALTRAPREDAALAGVAQALAGRLQGYSDNDFYAQDSLAQALIAAALCQASRSGLDVSPDICERMLQELRSRARYDGPQAAVALLGLTALGDNTLASLRYKADTLKDPTPIEAASLSRAFTMAGDTERAQAMLQSALNSLKAVGALAGKVAKAQDTASRARAFSELLNYEKTENASLSLDTAFVLNAAAAARDAKALSALDPAALSEPGALSMGAQALIWEASQGLPPARSVAAVPDAQGALKVKNDGDDAFYTLEVTGYPAKLSQLSDGIDLRLSLVSEDGVPLNPKAALTRHQECVMLLDLKRRVPGSSAVRIRTALPSGFALLQVLSDDGRGPLGVLSNAQVQQGDTGVLLTVGSPASGDLRLALLVRPDVSGTFTLPQIQVSDPANPGLQIFNVRESIIKVEDAATANRAKQPANYALINKR